MRRWLLAGAASGAIVACAAIAAFGVFEAAGPLDSERDVAVPRGGTARIARTLEASGVIGHAIAFELFAELTAGEGKLHAAELRFPAHGSLAAVLAVLREGKPVMHTITIPEGLTGAQIASLFARDDLLSGEVRVPAEGSVLPQSYAYERGALRSDVLKRAQSAMDAVLGRSWRERSPSFPLATARDALILASIVERETAMASERGMVSRVFLNRLRLGMRLQSDPTAIYAATGGLGRLERPVTRGDLEEDGPYNTYVIKGLPAGPICSPGAASIDAVLHPIASDFLYFVADRKGGHSFAATLAEHELNVARYRQNGER